MRKSLPHLSSVLFAAIVAATASGQPAGHFVAKLAGANEVPPTPSAASGTGQFTLNPDGSVTYQVSTSGVIGTAAHLHLGAAGVNGPILVPLNGGPTTWSGTSTPLAPASIAALQSGGTYVNVHSAAFPAGEIRGQLHAQQVFAGLPHTAVGKATLALSGARLAVANIGSSGMDGVEIALGATEYHTVTLETAGAAALPTGAALRVSSRGELNGLQNQEILALRIEDVGNEFGLSVEAGNLAPQSITVEATLAGNVVASAIFTTSVGLPPIVTFPPQGCYIDPVWPMNGDVWALVGLATSGPTTILGLPPVIADQVHLLLGNPAATLGSLSATVVVADNVPSFEIVTEELGMFGHGHTALGAATITGVGGAKVTVSNIGSSGQDGVVINLGDANQADLQLDPVSLSALGAHLAVSATGTFSGVAKTDLGGASLTNVGSTIDVQADFSALGANQVRVEVWQGAAFQGSAVVPGGANVATLLSTGVPVTGCGKFPPDPPCIYIDFDHDIGIDPAGPATAITGNQLRLLANNATGVINSLASYTLLAANVPDLVLICEAPASNAYGVGCPTVAGQVPQLSMSPCPTAGSTVSLSISQALRNTIAVVLVGATPTAIPVGGGCSLLVAPILTQIALPLSPTGGIDLPIALPTNTAGITVYLQAFVLNPTPLGFAATNGFRLAIEP